MANGKEQNKRKEKKRTEEQRTTTTREQQTKTEPIRCDTKLVLVTHTHIESTCNASVYVHEGVREGVCNNS